MSSGRLLLTLRGHCSVITDLAVSPDNSLLASSSDDKTVRVWDPCSGATLAVLRGHEASVNLVRFAPAESVLASASEDGTCRLWDLRDRQRCVCSSEQRGRGWLAGWLAVSSMDRNPEVESTAVGVVGTGGYVDPFRVPFRASVVS